jgi:hypothetical protein
MPTEPPLSVEFDSETQTYKTQSPQKWYAYIVEGEVVWMQTVSPSLEYLVAVMSSDPKIVSIPEEIAGKMIYGWTYDENGFHEPTEEQ